MIINLIVDFVFGQNLIFKSLKFFISYFNHFYYTIINSLLNLYLRFLFIFSIKITKLTKKISNLLSNYYFYNIQDNPYKVLASKLQIIIHLLMNLKIFNEIFFYLFFK